MKAETHRHIVVTLTIEEADALIDDLDRLDDLAKETQALVDALSREVDG